MQLVLTEKISGLSSQEAQAKLKEDGYNELPAEKRKHLPLIIFNTLKEPMILLLLICISIYALSGDVREALVLLISIFFIVIINIYQEDKTERALEALKSLSSPQAFVWRDGEYIKLDSRELVREDVIFLKEGDRVPADGVLIWNKGLSINESLLTGEAVPVAKKIGARNLRMARPQGENSPFIYSGTMVVSGQGIASVKATGQHTEVGHIGKMLDEVKEGHTPLQKNITQLVKDILVVAIILCLAVVVLNLMTAHALLPSFLSGITLAMAILPEEFPVVLAIFLSIGAWRLSRHQVLVRKMNAIESLGAATTLCVDKTGTLTMNKMKMDQIFIAANQEIVKLADFKNEKNAYRDYEALKLLIKASSLASSRNTFDPLENAIKELRREFFHEDIYQNLELAREHPLSAKLLMMANFWKNGTRVDAYTKGSPEAIISLCGLSAQEEQTAQAKVIEMAQAGLRVLGLAYAVDVDENSEVEKIKFQFLGLIAFSDPVRELAAAAISECYQAGIKVKIITGDYPETAKSIARQIGLKNSDQVMSGPDFTKLNTSELKHQVKDNNIFARMMPEYKLQIIAALEDAGEIVVMTGDGVNDGPALKAADIGVAMGKRGTDVARESADIVLLDDNFSSLVGGVREGRKIYNNLQRAIVYLVAVHIPIAVLSLIPIMLGWPLIFFPAHIMFLELLIDPVCSVVFEAEVAGPDIMKNPPRNSKKSILNRSNLLISLIQGGSILIFVFLIFYGGIHFGLESEKIRAMSFATLVGADIFLILANRSWSENLWKSFKKPNPFLWPIAIFGLTFLIFSIYNPFLRDIFSFAVLSPQDWAWPIIFSLCPTIIFELMKTYKRSRLKKESASL